MNMFFDVLCYIFLYFFNGDYVISLWTVTPRPTMSKCYANLGCVTYTPEWYHKINRPVNNFPLSRHTVNTQFLLYSAPKANVKEPILIEVISAVPATINISAYDVHRPLKMMIHDFTSSGYTGWIKHICQAIMEQNVTANLVSVNWEEGAEPPYIQAIGNALLVSLEIDNFLGTLANNFGLDLSQVHIIGHGVGAHIAGYVGKGKY